MTMMDPKKIAEGIADMALATIKAQHPRPPSISDEEAERFMSQKRQQLIDTIYPAIASRGPMTAEEYRDFATDICREMGLIP